MADGDFTWFKIIHRGWSDTILDDYPRYIITWRLCASMSTEDVKETIEAATGLTGVRDSKVLHRPRLLSDNGACHVFKALKEYLNQQGFAHTHHPMTRGKIERYHRSMKNIPLLESYYSPDELLDQIGLFVDYYNNYRYHEALKNFTPADVYFDKGREILTRRENIKKITMRQRSRYNCSLKVA